jgi:enamine deaminase RidA (YjgF/YER057c/UK114 family)
MLSWRQAELRIRCLPCVAATEITTKGLDGHFDWLVTGHWQFQCNSNAACSVIIYSNCRKNVMYMPAETVPSRSPTETGGAPVRIRRQHGDGLDLVAIESSPVSELHLTVTPMKGESINAMAKRLAEALNPWDATVVRQIVFGSTAAYEAMLKTLRQALDDPELPVIWVEGAGCAGNAIAGMQIHAVAGARVRTLGDHGVVTRIWDDALATRCVVSPILPARTQAPPPEQAREVFERLQTGLASAGMTMKDIVRTWFYLDDMLSWYGEFNRVRNDVFARNELRPPSLPASTGVGGRNPMGAALAAAAWAVAGCWFPARPALRATEKRNISATRGRKSNARCRWWRPFSNHGG